MKAARHLLAVCRGDFSITSEMSYPRAMDRTAALKVFESLSSPARLDIFCALVSAGMDGMVAGDLARALGVPANNLSFHLKTMREAGLLSVQAEGRYQRYRANIAHMLRLLAFVTDNCCYKAEPSRNKREHLPVVPAPLAQVRRNTSTAKGSRRNHQKGEPK
jgi:DNA-binding transcriptional ArsR family regulator